MENKNRGNKNKIILGDFNCTMDKIEWDGGNKKQTLQILFFYVSLSFPQLQRLFLMKNTKNNHSSTSDWWENTKSSFKDFRTFSDN